MGLPRESGETELELRLIRLIAYFLAGAVALGAVLDARSNAIALSNPEAAVLALFLVAGWALAELRLRRGAATWRSSDGAPVKVTRLGPYPRLAIVGALALLAYSRMAPADHAQPVAHQPLPSAPSRLVTATPSAPGAPSSPSPSERIRQAQRRTPVSNLGTRLLDDLVCEARLTCTLSESAELPPNEVDFMPIGGGSDAELKGAAGNERLRFVSPVRFRQHSTSITIINQFALAPAAELRGKPVDALQGYEVMAVPIVTVVYGKACARMRLLEVSVRVNGVDLWYGQWQYDVAFQQGPLFQVPLAGLHVRLKDRR